MARRLAWSDVRGGLIASAVILATAFAILKYSRLGALHGDVFKLYALVGEARGVLEGSEVWLNGQKIGKVTHIRFLTPAESSPRHRLELTLHVLEKYRTVIRRDALAQIRNGGSLIGAPVVYLSSGTPAAPMMMAGDTIRTRPQADAEGATGQFGLASQEFPVIINNVKLLAAQLATTEGTIGAYMNRNPLGSELDVSRTTAAASRIMRQVAEGPLGSSNRESLMSRARTAMARADSVRGLVSSPTSPVSRVRHDSTLFLAIGDVRNELSIVRAQIDRGDGTAGRVLRDSALVRAVHESEGQMTLLFADAKKHPFRYIRF